VQGTAGGEGFEGFDVGVEDADIAVGEAGRGAAALLEFLLAGGGAGSTRTLRTPSCSMKRRDSSRAPAPMASMPMTLPTPKTMPRAVSRVRVFCENRLWNASPMSDQ
jgi:hypothetical protein